MEIDESLVQLLHHSEETEGWMDVGIKDPKTGGVWIRRTPKLGLKSQIWGFRVKVSNLGDLN